MCASAAIQIVASVEPDVTFAPDEDVWLAPDLNRLHFFDGVTGLAIRDKVTSPGQMPRANFASETMAVEDTPVTWKSRRSRAAHRPNPRPLPEREGEQGISEHSADRQQVTACL